MTEFEKFRSAGNSNTAREYLFQFLLNIGLNTTQFVLHSLRSKGGKVTNLSVRDRLFKLDKVKDNYVNEDLKSKFSVSKLLRL